MVSKYLSLACSVPRHLPLLASSPCLCSPRYCAHRAAPTCCRSLASQEDQKASFCSTTLTFAYRPVCQPWWATKALAKPVCCVCSLATCPLRKDKCGCLAIWFLCPHLNQPRFFGATCACQSTTTTRLRPAGVCGGNSCQLGPTNSKAS